MSNRLVELAKTGQSIWFDQMERRLVASGDLQRMIDEDRYCVDILNQISAVRSALDAVGVEVLTNHVECCVVGHGTGTTHRKAKPMKPAQLLAELLAGLLAETLLASEVQAAVAETEIAELLTDSRV